MVKKYGNDYWMDTHLTMILPYDNYERLVALFKASRSNTRGRYGISRDVGFVESNVKDVNDFGMAEVEMFLDCKGTCERTLFEPNDGYYYGLKDLVDMFQIKRLWCFGKNDYEWFWESAFYDATKQKEVCIEYDEGNLPGNYGCRSLSMDEKTPANFKDGSDNYYDEYQNQFEDSETWELDLGDDQ